MTETAPIIQLPVAGINVGCHGLTEGKEVIELVRVARFLGPVGSLDLEQSGRRFG